MHEGFYLESELSLLMISLKVDSCYEWQKKNKLLRLSLSSEEIWNIFAE